MTLISIAEAIAEMEGFNAPGSPHDIPTRDNNPGDIEAGPFAASHGAIGTDSIKSRFARFPDAATGFAALRALLSEHYIGLTVAEALNRYAPPVENQTNEYIAYVCERTGLTPETVLTTEIVNQ